VPGTDDDDNFRRDCISFDDAAKIWREHWVKKHSSKAGYEVNLDAHLLPRLGARRLDEIGHADVAGLRADLRSRSVSTVNNIEVALRSVLRTAVAHGKLAAMPKLPALRKVPRKIIVPPTIDDIQVVLAAAYPAAKVALGLAAYAGLRAGEVVGLRVRHVDAKANVIRVCVAVSHGVEGSPKSGNERTIPIAEPLRQILAPVLARPHKPDDFISVSSHGTQWGHGSILHAFNSVMAKVNLPKKRLHDLRHFFVTECFRAGVPAPDVQKLAGHLHLHVTQRYAHADEQSQQEAMRKFDLHLATSTPPSGNGVETASPEATSTPLPKERKHRKSKKNAAFPSG